jgi:hypothetical protein
MGTSSRMTPSIKGDPNWGKLSDSVTRACDGDATPAPKLKKIVGRFVKALGGASKAGRGKSSAGGRAGVTSGKRIAGFFGMTSQQGFREALRETGLDNLEGKSVQDVINHLLDYCAENAGTVDDVAARAAASNLFSELFNEEGEIDDMEDLINNVLDSEGLDNILTDFFAHYIYEHLSTRFAENLEQAKSPQHCQKLFKEIKDLIFEDVKDLNNKIDLEKVDWSGKEGDRIIKDIFEETLKIYEGYED